MSENSRPARPISQSDSDVSQFFLLDQLPLDPRSPLSLSIADHYTSGDAQIVTILRHPWVRPPTRLRHQQLGQTSSPRCTIGCVYTQSNQMARRRPGPQRIRRRPPPPNCRPIFTSFSRNKQLGYGGWIGADCAPPRSLGMPARSPSQPLMSAFPAASGGDWGRWDPA